MTSITIKYHRPFHHKVPLLTLWVSSLAALIAWSFRTTASMAPHDSSAKNNTFKNGPLTVFAKIAMVNQLPGFWYVDINPHLFHWSPELCPGSNRHPSGNHQWIRLKRILAAPVEPAGANMFHVTMSHLHRKVQLINFHALWINQNVRSIFQDF